MRTDFGGGSLSSRILNVALRATVRPVIHAWLHTPTLPWPYFVADQAGRFQRKVPGTVVEPVTLPHCRAELVTTPSSDSGRVIVYFHGGAFVVGGHHLHRAMISRIAEATRSTVLAMEYRKLPKHPISISTEDGLDAYQHALALGVRPEDVVFMGDSAGGYLTFTVADLARTRGLPSPSCIVSMSPLTDLDLERSPLDLPRGGCTLFPPGAIPVFARLAQARAGLAGLQSPADCLLSGMPPVLLQVSSSESLYHQVVLMAERLEEAGVLTELQVWDGQVHVFQAARLLPEAQQAVTALASYVDRVAPARRRLSATA